MVAGASAGTGEVKEVAISRANVAAQIMEHLCNCAGHGYSQPGRHGTSGHCSVKTDAGVVKVTKGDRDCSSAVCETWELALAGSAYDGLITRYNWTGGMREMFVGSGLFSWKPMSFNDSRGDIYLDESTHTAMCVRNDGTADLLAEFSISETGGIDGEPGDVSELAARVIAGKFGNGDEHKRRLGDKYSAVQRRVNEILDAVGTTSTSMDVDAMARAVIRGDYGNGEERKRRLGSYYSIVQRRVNEILS